ncbi:MAG: GNAT family N-acetyltransferase [Chitinophagales bacterium]
MHILLETDRLILRSFEPMDVHLIYALDSDPRVLQYIRPVTTDMAGAQATYEKIMRTAAPDPRFGNWVALRKNDNKPIGWFCLKDLDGTGEYEIGYRLVYAHWGNGYATEGALALLKYARETCQLPYVVAVTHKDNMASQRVLEKCGLHFIHTADYYGHPCKYYKSDLF